MGKFKELIGSLQPEQLTRLNNSLTLPNGTFHTTMGELLVQVTEGGTMVLGRLSGPEWATALPGLAEDLAENTNLAFRNKLLAQPELVDSWKVLKEVNFESAVTNRIEYLKNVNDYFKKYPNRSFDDFNSTLLLFDNSED